MEILVCHEAPCTPNEKIEVFKLVLVIYIFLFKNHVEA